MNELKPPEMIASENFDHNVIMNLLRNNIKPYSNPFHIQTPKLVNIAISRPKNKF